ncbi:MULTISPECIES: tetratricopeptide repeat protein [Spirosoma]|uniref:Uncharacterized protein n=1 Tax=Spirosoma sordidisoli TaxID=2502893 RepID=A0A4Q2UMC5_9BACT|nr:MULTISPECIES: tetratricopeptide repeat protein [Spirosoma]RYC70763.1 hypothetical protein EQG79_01005 [Spirosoma sordidisoli]
MIYVLMIAWLWWSETVPVNQISLNNQARQEAESAYRAGHYQQALRLYVFLSQATSTADPAVRLNLGHTYFQLRQYKKAGQQYQTLLDSDRSALRTVAATQLGIIACLDHDSTAALTLFRQALLEDFTNEPARYNFELISKRYTPRPPSRQAPAKSTAEIQQQADQPSMGNGQVERSSRQDDLLRRFRQLNLTQDQALQLLDAMQTDDLPYALTRSARRVTSPTAGENRW